MEDNKNIFDYISKVFVVFGVVILIHVIIGSLVGEDASELSTLFKLGSEYDSAALCFIRYCDRMSDSFFNR